MPEKIVITKQTFGLPYTVTFEPRSISWPSREFRSHAEAKGCAEARSKAHGWPIEDQAKGGTHE